jgi:hemoglobin/transferrin/lactoferrin receptor protein
MNRLHILTPLLSFSALPAWAQVSPPAVELPPVTVTGTRLDQPLANTPQSVQTLEGTTLRQRQVRTLPEALREIPGVLVQKTSNGQGSPFLRGFTGFRTLAMVDGIRYNNSILREGPNEYWALLDPLAAERLEVIYGPGGVSRGSDAVGGMMNFLSQGSGFADQATGQSFTSGAAQYRFHSSERSHQGRAEINFGKGGDWGFHAGVSQKDYGDLEAADLGKQPFTGYTQTAWDAKFEARPAKNWLLTVASQGAQQDDAWRTHSTIYAVPFAGSSKGTDLRRVLDHERSLTYARLEGMNLSGAVQNARITISRQTLSEQADRIKEGGAREQSGFDLATWGLDAQFQSNTGLGKLSYGVDYYRDEVDSNRTDTDAKGARSSRIQGPVGDDATYDLMGVYLMDEINLTDRLDVELGGRYTLAKADIGRYEDPISKTAASTDESWSQFTGSARLLYALDAEKSWKVFGGAGQSFRAPNLSDLSRLDIARSGEVETASAGLEPEEFLSFELGVRHQAGRATFSAAYFLTEIDNQIVRRPTGRTIDGLAEVGKANAGDGRIHGFEISGRYELGSGFSVFGNLAWQEGEGDTYPSSSRSTAREPLSRILPLQGLAGMRWDGGEAFWTELVCVASGDADRLNTADRGDTQRIPPNGTPGYTLVTLRAGWRVSDNFEVMASLDNVLDEAYRVHGSGTNEPGIGVSLSARASF